METIIIIVISITMGAIVGWLLTKNLNNQAIQTEKDAALTKYNELDKQWAAYQAKTESELKSAEEYIQANKSELSKQKDTLEEKQNEVSLLNHKISETTAELRSAQQNLQEKKAIIDELNQSIKDIQNEASKTQQALATAKAVNQSLEEKLQTQKEEIEALGKRFNTEFENIANKILETKTEKFTELNQKNLKTILEPLGENIRAFKSKVEEVYDKESKERFSLGEKVKELSELNKVISEEAHNLTKALKGEAKTQGRWGEMILESILEKSGLVKDREYFMEHELLDSEGNHLKSDSEGKKMRPDAVIQYPDNRTVIIDSKVSLNAFTRYIDASDVEVQKQELAAHVAAIKAHIVALSAKGYDDYDKALDFVMMFVPSEPAYMAALQGAPDLWNFAYDKRILLLSPTNLITSLKLIADLWKREYQNQNALQIAERGAKLYDKFVGFVSNLEDLGSHLEKAQGKYVEAYKQMSTGNDNLVAQATKLKNLGLKTKKELPPNLVDSASNTDLIE